jgi:hypothetical protein
MQRLEIRRELERQERSYSWLASKITVTKASKQNVADWLSKENPRTPRDVRVFGDMATALGIELTTPKIAVGFAPLKVRLAGNVPAGDWGDPLASDEFIDVTDTRFEHPRRFAAHVVGTSCYPFLQPGDLTIWHLDPDPNYQVFVLAQRKGDHGCTVKELLRDEKNQRPILHSPNPAHDDPEDGSGWGVIARLVGVQFQHDGANLTVFEQTGVTKRKLAFRQKMFDES